jgi:hypothetical protein
MHLGADIRSGRRTANAMLATPRIARLTSTILPVRRGGADGDALWFMPPSERERRCGGVGNFEYARDTTTLLDATGTAIGTAGTLSCPALA